MQLPPSAMMVAISAHPSEIFLYFELTMCCIAMAAQVVIVVVPSGGLPACVSCVLLWIPITTVVLLQALYVDVSTEQHVFF